MEYQSIEQLKAEIGKVSPDQVLDLQYVIQAIISQQVAEVALVRRTQSVIQSKTCPHCGGVDVVLHGPSWTVGWERTVNEWI